MIGNLTQLNYIKDTNSYTYSENKPGSDINKYWHYVEGIPTVWTDVD